MKIAIFSGKGGTGKSSVVSSLACGMEGKRLVLADTDVDCPNQHLLFTGKTIRKKRLHVSETAVFDDNGIAPSICPEVCRFDAIRIVNKKAVIDKVKCEGCGACVLAYPEALRLVPKFSGEIIVRKTPDFHLIYGKLEPGESGSGKVVFEVKKIADEIAKREKAELIIVDAPAGIGCPVIAAITGCDYAIGIVEPTPASIANLERALEVVKHFNIPYSIVINKKGISGLHEKIIRKKFGKTVIAEIPYDEEIPGLLARGIAPIKGRGDGAKYLKKAVGNIEKLVEDRNEI